MENLKKEEQPNGLSTYLNAWGQRVKSGDLGSLPIILGLIVIALIFGIRSDGIFFRPRNFVNLLLQMSGTTAIAIGVVFVLLIAEIDLSVAFVGAVGGVWMTLLLDQEVGAIVGEALNTFDWESGFILFRAVQYGFLTVLNVLLDALVLLGLDVWKWWAAIGFALLVTTMIGLLHGLLVTKAKVPSFVVTLAGLLAWSGVVLIMTTTFSTGGTINVQDAVVKGISGEFLPNMWGWLLAAAIIIGYAAIKLYTQRMQVQRNLASTPFAIVIFQIALLAVITLGVVWYANQDRGVPVVALIILAFLGLWSFVANRTKFGRYVYAVGGNPEAARRAGINVDGIRIRVFMISSFMAGVGGIILASRLGSVSTNTGGGNLLLNAIAAAVIGGTSLFGGTGKVSSALLGALIIASVENGMGLLGLPSGVKFVVNGLVLLAAVLIDSFSRRSRAASGLA